MSIMLSLLLFTFLAKLSIESPVEECPPSDIISPCECFVWSVEPGTRNWEIRCSASTATIREVFRNVTPNGIYSTSYDIFKIDGVSNVTLTKDLLGPFQFRIIKVVNSNISAIEEDAFESNYDFTEQLEFMNNNFDVSLRKGEKLFQVIKKFKKLKTLFLMNSNLQEIPKNAFTSNETLDKLSILRFNRNLIEKIGDFAFFKLESVTWLDLAENRLTQISENAFTFEKSSEKPIQIDLDANLLTAKSFHHSSFRNVRRPTVLFLRSNNITYLDESTFLPLLQSGIFRLFPSDNPLICNCENRWILGHPQIKEQLSGMNCEDGESIWVKKLSNFKICDIQKKDVIHAIKNFIEILFNMGIVNDFQRQRIEHILN
ncbi:protein slit-like protein [Dinothrombium tinctorium]|nr:protein slit-like protein [Dinothrombium tinctorium]